MKSCKWPGTHKPYLLPVYTRLQPCASTLKLAIFYKFSTLFHRYSTQYSIRPITSMDKKVEFLRPQSRAKTVETLYLFQILFHSRTSLFSFPLPPISMLSRSQNLLENLAYSTLKRGRGKSTGFNAILLKTRNISEIVANFG